MILEKKLLKRRRLHNEKYKRTIGSSLLFGGGLLKKTRKWVLPSFWCKFWEKDTKIV
jgi:hypothetical protein